MGVLDGLLEQVKQAIGSHAADHPGVDASKLINHITDLFGSHPANGPSNAKPASRDPYGDAGLSPTGQRNVKPASEDPYGDPDDGKR